MLGIEAWTRDHAERRVDDDDSGASREARLDLARRREAETRQRQSIRDWTERGLRGTCDPMLLRAAPRAVLAHRNAWLKAKVSGVRCTPDEAFNALVEMSQHSIVKLRDVAERLVRETTEG